MVNGALIFHWYLCNTARLNYPNADMHLNSTSELAEFLKYTSVKSGFNDVTLRKYVFDYLEKLLIRGRSIKGFTLAIRGKEIGMATCSACEDSFNRKMGVKIALEKLEKIQSKFVAYGA